MNLKTRIGKTTFNNPIWVASGTFGNGKEFAEFLKLKDIGAIVTKTVTLEKREGNPAPRIVETPAGMLNSIGLENPGADVFIKEKVPFLKKEKATFIVSIAGFGDKDFLACVEKLKKSTDTIELNLSCPNVTHKGTKHKLIAQDAKATAALIKKVRKNTKQNIIAKLTPNVTDIATIAKAAEDSGADAVALVNTYLGMAVDAETQKPILGNIVGGLSGPAIKPMALKAVRDVYKKVKIPVIGIGGIMTGTCVAEFMLCGASAVQVGTANFTDPKIYEKILKEFKEYLKRKKIKAAKDLVGELVVSC